MSRRHRDLSRWRGAPLNHPHRRLDGSLLRHFQDLERRMDTFMTEVARHKPGTLIALAWRDTWRHGVFALFAKVIP